MIITQTMTAVPTGTGRTPVQAMRFSHPAPDAPEGRWTDVTTGSPLCAPLRFLAPPGDDQPTEWEQPTIPVHKGQSSWQRARRVGAESKAHPRGGRGV
jgi:hypothetical protein